MNAPEWACVIVLALIPLIGLTATICEEIGKSREDARWRRKWRIIALERECDIPARESWYADE